VASAEGVFRFIVDEARDFAIFLMDPAGRIETWNRGAQIMMGYSPAEVTGRHFAMLFTPQDRANGIPERELDTARTAGSAEDTRWHVRKDDSRFFADGVTMAIRNEAGEVAGFCKIQRDITERHQTQQRLAAQLALTNLLNEEQPFDHTAVRVLECICEHLGWDIASLWEADRATGRLQCIQLWHGPEVDAEAAGKLCRGQSLEPGVGLPGAVWTRREPVWIVDFRERREFPRMPSAEAAGMAAAFAFPILLEGRVIGVMEFFSRDSREPDQALLPEMALIGAHIGDYIERRRTTEALRQSEERYRLVSETAQDAIFTIDAQSNILLCNPAVERMFGWKPEELVGRNLDVIIPERFRERHRAGMAHYIATHEKRIPWTGVELPGLHRNGGEIPLEISFGEWNGTTFTGFARDIADRKRALEKERLARAEAEAARAQLERRADEEAAFRHLASALTGAVEMTEVLYEITNRASLVTRADGVYVERIIDADGLVEIVSTSGRGTPPRGLRVPYPGSLTEEIAKNRQPVVLTDMNGFGASMAPYLLDSCSDCQVLVTPLVAEDELLGALVLLNSRHSGRKFRDNEIVRARTLGDLTSLALRRVRLMEQERGAKEKAEAAVRVRDETLGIVSHDLRNPLTKIALSADLLKDAEPDEAADLIETIRASAGQMERLIQDLLDVARLEAGRFSVEAKKIDAEELVRFAAESHEALAAQKGQHIALEVASPLPPICGDRGRLLQVFGNLIGNAIKFTPERGTITVEAASDGSHVRFRVRDTGPGIPEADIKNVFRPYWQAKKTAHMGAGLGLAIVRGIIDAQGGKVWAGNEPRGGAVFTFTVPVV
jgi:PAS domain S-box-containing protein